MAWRPRSGALATLGLQIVDRGEHAARRKYASVGERRGKVIAPPGHVKYIELSALAHVTGGMNTEGFPISDNVEDRRGMSVKDSMRAKSPAVAPLPPLVRTPGDLSSQAGLDNIGRRRR